jgi:hypothetical protein
VLYKVLYKHIKSGAENTGSLSTGSLPNGSLSTTYRDSDADKRVGEKVL